MCNLASSLVLMIPEETKAPQVTEDGMELEEPSKETTEESTVPAEPQLPSEFEKLFKGCEENPDDFNGWVYLLQYVEQEVRDNMQIIQTCVDTVWILLKLNRRSTVT